MKQAIIFANGNLSNISQAKKIITKDDYIVCADGGVKRVIRIGLIPHVIIGDFDSIPGDLRNKLSQYKIDWVKYPEKKDKTDFELAIDFVLKKKYKNIIIFGLLGDRLDHFLANIFLLEKIHTQNNSLKIKIIEGNKEAVFVNKELELKGNIGDLVSLIPLNNTIDDIKLYGLEYQLNNKPLLFGSTRGVSNTMTKKSAKIIIKKGIALIVHFKNHSITSGYRLRGDIKPRRF